MTTSVRARNNTIVRSNFAAPRVVRSAFSLLEHTAPAAGAWWATRLWCTVPGTKQTRVDNRPYPGTIGTVDLPGGVSVVTESWGHGPAIYLVHGWGGWRGQLGAFVEPLLARGHRVVAFDAPSHGDSSGGMLGPHRTTLAEIAQAVAAVVESHGTAVAILGHSIGSAAAAMAVHDGMPVNRLGFVSPSVQPIGLTREMAKALGFGERTRTAMLRRLESIVGRPMSDFDLLTMGDRVTMPPTLVVHDRDDREIAHAEAELLVASWQRANLVSTSGLGHRRILREPEVIELITTFVASPPDSSGSVGGASPDA